MYDLILLVIIIFNRSLIPINFRSKPMKPFPRQPKSPKWSPGLKLQKKHCKKMTMNVVVVWVSLSIFYIFQVTTLFPFLVMLFTFSPLGWAVKLFLAVKFPLAPFASPHYSIWLDGQTLPFFDVARNVCLSPKPLPSDVLKKVLNCQGSTFVLYLLFCSNHLNMSSKL